MKPENRSFSKNRKLASEAGRKGGSNIKAENRTFYTNRALAAEAGRKGGKKTQGNKKNGSENNSPFIFNSVNSVVVNSGD